MSDETRDVYDLAVIGGGIAGAAIARDAALRGARVILFEAKTFGSGTSSKSSKLVHGGIRYLELSWAAFRRGAFGEAWKNFRFVFHSLRECATLERIAPELVKPIPLVIPVYRGDTRSPFTVYLGAALYSVLSVFAGRGRLATVFGSKKAVLRKLPELKEDGLRGGIQIWDHLTDDLSLVRAVAADAMKHGAHCHEHARVTGFDYRFEENVYSVKVEGAPAAEYRARKLLNATGPWVDKTRELMKDKEYGENLIEPVAGAHVTLKRFLPVSALLQAGDGRVFFVINRGEEARVGTTEWDCPDPDSVKPRKEDVDYLLDSLKKYFPGRRFSLDDVLSSDAAVRPLAKPSRDQRANEISREHAVRVDHAGVIHVLGVKITDHRRAAEEIVGELVPQLLRTNPSIRTKSLTSATKL